MKNTFGSSATLRLWIFGLAIFTTLQSCLANEFLYWEFHERAFSQAALYQGRWKGIRSQRSDAPIEVYDLQNDIGETTNVADQNPEIVAAIDQYLRSARSHSETWPARWADE